MSSNAAVSEQLVHEVRVVILVDAAVRVENKRQNTLGLLKPRRLHVLTNKLENINLSGDGAPLQAVVEAEESDELLENDVVLGHDLLADVAVQAHYGADDLLDIEVLDDGGVD
eukprot:CAMPEP_0170495874 /NCGR_PEP_ID=MMETSP0208-20121228/19091_1 /TAXON_ID=197538 /ORGANISM="Strombidium inclinatum, Strain S3" /LENGTH=112 /DNA_ID=CAMNT_0010772255 /DNA_START=666 /DNA_END=1002 /DNA_ORIENTATION=+